MTIEQNKGQIKDQMRHDLRSVFRLFTLVVPTHNRYDLLLRLLKYYASFNFPFRIIVLDSSNIEITSLKLKTILEQNENVIRVSFSPEIFFPEKVARGVENVTTPYVALCADDDFIVPRAIVECVDFLQGNNSYSCAQGIIIKHAFSHKSGPADFKWIPTYHKTGSNEYVLPHDRLSAYLLRKGREGGQQFYAVHRSGLFKKIWADTVIYASDFLLSEIFSAGLSMIAGKRKVLPILYSSRESHNHSPWGKLVDTSYSPEKCSAVEHGFVENLIVAEGIDLEQAQAYVSRAMMNFLDSIYSRKRASTSLIGKISSLIAYVKNGLLHKWYRFRYQNVFGAKGSNYYDDFKMIERSIVRSSASSEYLDKVRESYS